jgi:glycosyltransferase involved in cell wall biosynthesis
VPGTRFAGAGHPRLRRAAVVRIVFVTQAADPAHPVLGATLAKIRELAERVEEVVVIADSADGAALPENCRVRTFAAPSQAARGARYVAALAPELVDRPVAVVAHMAPVFAVIAAPLARPLRVPLLLWFTQQASGRALVTAERVVDRILTVDARTVPISSPKVRAIGHGIDVAALACVPERRPPLRRLLGLGRYAPVKGWETVLRALPQLPDATLTVHGPTLTEADRDELPRLDALAGELGVRDRVTLSADVPYARVPQLFGLADAVVNATHGNAADKVVYEAAAACLPVFAASPVFDALLPDELRFHGDHAGSLAEKIAGYRGGAGPVLRARVEAEHSAAHWAERVLEEAGA